MSNPGFRVCDNKGFHVTFANGYTVSVQFGPCNYCDNHDASFSDPAPKRGWQSGTAETAVWGSDGQMLGLIFERDGAIRVSTAGIGDDGYVDTVQGYRTPADALALLAWAASQEAK